MNDKSYSSLGQLGVLGSTFAEIERERRQKWEQRTKMWADLEKTHPGIAHLRGLAISGIMSDDADGRAAHAAYFKLLGAGLEASELFEIAIGMAVLACSAPARQHSGSRPGRPIWLEGSGKTHKTLEYFPRRLRNMAEEIEKLNAHPFFKPEMWVKTRKLPSDSARKLFALWFERLPTLLHHYAAFLDAHLRSLRESFKHRSRARGPNDSTQVLVALVDIVRKETGRPHYNELAAILNAAGRKAGVDEDFSPDRLKMDVSRYRKQEPQKSDPRNNPTSK